jgi:Histidine kinase/Histidine kinase-, DNA gyrase B-, and HSP90-like ATPase
MPGSRSRWSPGAARRCRKLRSLSRFAYLFEGLTVRRVLAVTVICVVAAGATRWFFTNSIFELLLIALCIGYTSMLFFTIATNLRVGLRREVRQVLAIVLGSFLGTLLAGLARGFNLSHLLTERLWGASMTMGLGIGIGCVVLAAAIIRERQARDEARLHRAEAERQQLERSILEAKLQLMQAQVEPHFLFNTLANVQHLVETDPPAASRMLDSLIRYLRAALPQMRENATTLRREIEMARAFLEIQRVRMGSRLEYAIEVPPQALDMPFPPMMLLSLVENAIKHGADPCCESVAVTLRASHAEGRLTVSVADTGEGIVPKKGGGVGLANIRERLKTLHGQDARLVLEENQPRGVIASIEVPMPDAALDAPPLVRAA